jgi:hypothetical protein
LALSFEDTGGIMKRKILYVLAVCVIVSALWSDELFTKTVDLEPYLYYMSGFTVASITPRQTAELSDGGFVVLVEIELASGMLANYATVIVKISSEGDFNWVRFLTNNPQLTGFDIAMQGWVHGYCLYTTDEEIWVTGHQEWGNGISILAKYNLQGEHLDAITLSQGSELISIKSLKKAPNDTFYAIGQSIVQYYKEMYFSQITSDGDTLWTYHNEAYEKVYDMTVIPDNRILITAQTRDPGLVGDPIPRVICFDVETRSIIWETDFPTGTFDGKQITISDDINGSYYCGIRYFDDYEFYSLISKIDTSGTMQDLFILPTDFHGYYTDTPYNIVDNDTSFILTVKVDNSTDIVKVNEDGTIQWGIFQENCGEGVDVLAKTTDGNFVVVSTPDGEKLKLTKFDGDGNFTHIDNEVVHINEYSLEAYPNPFNPTTTISYSIPAAAAVELSIYNVKGQKVVTLVNQHQEAGAYSTQWNGTDEQNNSVASGVYFYKLSDDSGRSSVQKCLLLK